MRDDGCSCVPAATGGNWRSDALDPDGQSAGLGLGAEQDKLPLRVVSPDSEETQEGAQIGTWSAERGPGPWVLETHKRLGYREVERGQTIKSLQSRWGPTLVKTVTDFQCVSAQGL